MFFILYLAAEFSTTFNEDRYKEISTSDISYENYTIKNLILGFEDEISERPTINFDEYTSYDEFILNLLSF